MLKNQTRIIRTGTERACDSVLLLVTAGVGSYFTLTDEENCCFLTHAEKAAM